MCPIRCAERISEPRICLLSGSQNGQIGTTKSGSQKAGPTEGVGVKQSKLTLYQANTFCSADEVMSAAGVLTHSDDAKNLRIKCMDTLFFKVLTRQLEMLQWQMYSLVCKAEQNIILNFENKKEGLCRMLVPVDDRLRLPFAGTLTTTNSKGALHFCKMFGVDFYVQPKDSKELATVSGTDCDVLVAAWHAKAVAKPADAYLCQELMKMHFVCWREGEFDADPDDEAEKKVSEPDESYGCTSYAAELVFRLAKNDMEKERLIAKATMMNWPYCPLA